jgi:hypothetical protein
LQSNKAKPIDNAFEVIVLALKNCVLIAEFLTPGSGLHMARASAQLARACALRWLSANKTIVHWYRGQRF